MKSILGRHKLFAPVPMRESLAIDSRVIPAKESEGLIISHYKLQTK